MKIGLTDNQTREWRIGKKTHSYGCTEDWRENQAQTNNQDWTDNKSIKGNNSNLHVDYRGTGKAKNKTFFKLNTILNFLYNPSFLVDCVVGAFGNKG